MSIEAVFADSTSSNNEIRKTGKQSMPLSSRSDASIFLDYYILRILESYTIKFIKSAAEIITHTIISF
jgi:hypothetical protein